MFDFGFWEVMLVVVVALLVVGPERLPGLARTTGLWVGKARRLISDVKAEIDHELASEELNKIINKQDMLNDVYEVIEETKQVGQELKQEFRSTVDSATNETEKPSTDLPNSLNKKSAEVDSVTSGTKDPSIESPDSLNNKSAEKANPE
ncbi:MAG: twin-arginine translocase subunit TatB [Gammaproteobacteria bacterium]|nr:MAG: twin-arginine translocase subunit TatB [Gammaproteobacteria bacterium]